MNYGTILAWVAVALDLAIALGYLWVHDYRRCLYWGFAAGIAVTVIG
jgi:hypothetical protein